MKPPHVTWCAAAFVAASVVVGCGQTYIEESATATSVPGTATTLAPSVPTDASVADLEALLAIELSTLSQAVIDNDDLSRRSARIDEIWSVLEPKLDGVEALNMADVIELAQRAITSRRPADADKAYRLLLTVTEAS